MYFHIITSNKDLYFLRKMIMMDTIELLREYIKLVFNDTYEVLFYNVLIDNDDLDDYIHPYIYIKYYDDYDLQTAINDTKTRLSTFKYINNSDLYSIMKFPNWIDESVYNKNEYKIYIYFNSLRDKYIILDHPLIYLYFPYISLKSSAIFYTSKSIEFVIKSCSDHSNNYDIIMEYISLAIKLEKGTLDNPIDNQEKINGYSEDQVGSSINQNDRAIMDIPVIKQWTQDTYKIYRQIDDNSYVKIPLNTNNSLERDTTFPMPHFNTTR
jgi:hypothetical protein